MAPVILVHNAPGGSFTRGQVTLLVTAGEVWRFAKNGPCSITASNQTAAGSFNRNLIPETTRTTLSMLSTPRRYLHLGGPPIAAHCCMSPQNPQLSNFLSTFIPHMPATPIPSNLVNTFPHMRVRRINFPWINCDVCTCPRRAWLRLSLPRRAVVSSKHGGSNKHSY